MKPLTYLQKQGRKKVQMKRCAAESRQAHCRHRKSNGECVCNRQARQRRTPEPRKTTKIQPLTCPCCPPAPAQPRLHQQQSANSQTSCSRLARGVQLARQEGKADRGSGTVHCRESTSKVLPDTTLSTSASTPLAQSLTLCRAAERAGAGCIHKRNLQLQEAGTRARPSP